MNSQRIYNYHRFPNASPISIPIPIAFKIIRISDIILGRKSTLNHSTLKKRKRKRKQNCMEKRRRKRSPPLFIVIGEWIAKLHFSTASNSIVPPFLSRIRASPSDIHPVVVCHHAIYYLPIIPAPRRLRP